jgi:tRNA(Ile)-lysidine synthase
MVPAGAVVLALVSGGADSVALLRLLAAGELGEMAELSVLHVNHLLRGEEADADAAFVAALCESLGLPCRVVRYDVRGYAEVEGLNLEDAGRRVRYRFANDELDSRCAALGVVDDLGRIAVAHTYDDRLETLLMRLVSGSGPTGLRSIAPVRGRIVRPLITVRRPDVTEYLRELGQVWHEDVTNADTARLRAWVRHELLPLIESQNPAFDAVAARTMDILAEEDDLIGELADAFARDFARMEEGALVFGRPLMLTLSRPMARRTVREALVAAFPEASRLDFAHAEALVDGLADERFARDLPFGLHARAEYDRLRISRRDDEAPAVAPGLLDCPGAVQLGVAGRIEARLTGTGTIAPGPDRVSIDADSVAWPLVVDGPRSGDRMRPLGLAGTKKVSDVLVDAKVPRRLRRATPVIRDGDRIVWMAGVALAHECRVTPDTERVAELVWMRTEPGRGMPPQ